MNASAELAVRLGIAAPQSSLESALRCANCALCILMIHAAQSGKSIAQIIGSGTESIAISPEERLTLRVGMLMAQRSGKPPTEFFALVAHHMLFNTRETNKDLH